jgi:alpha-galactosidase
MLTQDDISIGVNQDDGTLTIQLGEIVLFGRCDAQLQSADGRTRRVRGRRTEALGQRPISDPHGMGKRMTVRYVPAEGQLALRLEASLYEHRRFVALRVGIENQGHATFRALALSPLTTLQVNFGGGPLDGWVNGFHSFGFTGFVPHTHRQPRPSLGPLITPQCRNPTTQLPRRPGQYVGEELCALLARDDQVLVAGFMGVIDQFGQVYADGRPGRKSLRLVNTADAVPLGPGETLWGEWAMLYSLSLPHPDPLGTYAEAVTRLVPARVPAGPPPAAWSSWYQFFDRVSAQDMDRNQRALRQRWHRLPLQLIQLDDGYQPQWGHWLEHDDKFPQGVAGWAEEVRQDGFEPGLWIGPFTVTPRSRIFRTRPEALLRNARGRPTYGGFLPPHWLKGLDPTHPLTRDLVRHTIETLVHKWGIQYLKLDFLYCAALPGMRHDPTRTRAQALRDGLELIRETAGEQAILLACGCPLGPAIGLVDIMRVSPDVAPQWYPQVYGIARPFRRAFSLPAARNSVAVSLNRAWTHRRWWWLDADNLVVREKQDMTAAEVQTLVTVEGMLGSHFVLSDDVARLSEERLRWAASLLPVAPGGVDAATAFKEMPPGRLIRRVEGPAGPITLLTLINWTDRAAPFSVALSDIGMPSHVPVLVYDYWNQSVRSHHGESLRTYPIPPHGVAHLALRPDTSDLSYVGTDLHICPGTEITQWEVSHDELRFQIYLGRSASGTVWLRLPSPPAGATCNGEPATIISNGTLSVYRLQIEVKGEADVRVHWHRHTHGVDTLARP